eukprot:11472290-Heterocapsa_arctica.AAC.1
MEKYMAISLPHRMDPNCPKQTQMHEESSEDEVAMFEIRAADMDTVVRHQEVPKAMTCKWAPDMDIETFSITG